ncbi:Predicted phage recombinase, RecA/RadA family [Sphingomonas gellani]|uniref:Predicted phage recombinase, RecA/RadA family n=1 Tax=Sphingomonas gellani TaxID=1166340 RepID=A0A1H7ZWR6_9SPHN|nr:DUF2190 family protein [Sphingomonas gellani]SEM62733.1 Predicted phage recombinase, RecA/RadA family [Sphingomonas gellani]
MRGFIHPGNVNTFVAPRALASGDGFIVGSDFAVATGPAAQGGEVEGLQIGVVDLPKATGANTDVTQGTKLYWDDANRRVTKSSAGNVLIGTARRDAATADTSYRVRLTGQIS